MWWRAWRARLKRRGCEILGLDPLYLANEGTLIQFAPPDEAGAALAAMWAQPEGAGRGARIIDLLVGAQLPRICQSAFRKVCRGFRMSCAQNNRLEQFAKQGERELLEGACGRGAGRPIWRGA